MILLIMILMISPLDGSGNKPVVIQQFFDKNFHFNAEQQCNKIKTQLEQAYSNQVISSKCVKGY